MAVSRTQPLTEGELQGISEFLTSAETATEKWIGRDFVRMDITTMYRLLATIADLREVAQGVVNRADEAGLCPFCSITEGINHLDTCLSERALTLLGPPA